MAESTSTELTLSSNDFSDGAISDQSQQEQRFEKLGGHEMPSRTTEVKLRRHPMLAQWQPIDPWT